MTEFSDSRAELPAEAGRRAGVLSERSSFESDCMFERRLKIILSLLSVVVAVLVLRRRTCNCCTGTTGSRKRSMR